MTVASHADAEGAFLPPERTESLLRNTVDGMQVLTVYDRRNDAAWIESTRMEWVQP